MTEIQSEQIRPETKEFIDETFFRSLKNVNNKLVKLESEEITLKQFRNFILEQRVWFAEQVVSHYHELSLQATCMEEKLLSIGKKLLENAKND
ncbi:MAG: hypothetical protein ACTSRE_16260 [Promethearchaeota archaeon]